MQGADRSALIRHRPDSSRRNHDHVPYHRHHRRRFRHRQGHRRHLPRGRRHRDRRRPFRHRHFRRPVHARRPRDDGGRRRIAPGGIDSLLAGAGISRPDPISVAVNYFGAIATLEGLRPLLARSATPRAVAICSTAAILQGNNAVVEACLAGDEAAALAACAAAPMSAYLDSKKALTLWLRAAAVKPEWAGASISLNGIGPGVVLSPPKSPR
jgi:hypothetical protein